MSLVVDKKKRVRNWVFTWNNYTPEDIEYCLTIPCRYIMFGEEVAPTTNTPHLQGVIVYNEAKSCSQVSKDLRSKVHLEPCVALVAAIAYNGKEGKVHEKGDRPKTQAEKGVMGAEATQLFYKKLREEAEAHGKVSDERIQFLHGSIIDRIHAKAKQKRTLPLTFEKHLWYYGPSGTGKSRKAREDHPDAYMKMCNKWWDGYDDEETVIIDDFDVRHEHLIHFLKIWTDHAAFNTEFKGVVWKIRPKLVIVTSNYHPKDIWTNASDLEPIYRRFKIVRFDNPFNVPVQAPEVEFVNTQFATN